VATHSCGFETQRLRLHAAVAVLLLSVPLLTGCRAMVAVGKMVLGDPVNKSVFEAFTGNNLEKTGDRVLIICTAPHATVAEFPSLQLELADRISRQLETRGLQVVPADDVAAWYDDNGEWGNYSKLADEFDATFVMHLHVRRFSYQEPSSPDLMRGRSEGVVKVYAFDEEQRPLGSVFEQNIRVVFPETYPVPRESRSVDVFVENLLDRISLQSSQMMYSPRLSETIH